MDEPTSSLTLQETERLLTLIGELRKQGVSVVYISHRLAEVDRVADRVVVLRDGRNAGELNRAEISHDRIVRFDDRPRYSRRFMPNRTPPKHQAICKSVMRDRAGIRRKRSLWMPLREKFSA